MLKDQRHMSGLFTRETREDVVAFWREHADDRAARGFRPFEMAPGRTELTNSRQHLKAYVSDSRWVADCNGGPTGKCRGGIACWPEHEHGCCLDCGTVYPIDFPEAATMRDGENALLVRPEQHRHWKPWEETPEDLRHENITHGYAPSSPGVPEWKTKLAAENGIPVGLVDEILASRERETKTKKRSG